MDEFKIYKTYELFKNKTILALDYGEKVIGTALYRPGVDPFPYPFEKIINQSKEKTFSQIGHLLEEEFVDVIVVGVPYYLDGNESKITFIVKNFILELKKTFPKLEILEQDETLSTQTAEERMRNSAQYNFKVDYTQIDSVSATIILEDFIRNS